MGIVVSMLMITAGAIMRFAVTAQGTGFNVHTTGMILLVIGVIGAVMSIVFWASWGGFGRGLTAQRTVMAPQTVVRAPDTTLQAPGTMVGTERTVVQEREVQGPY